MVIPDREEVDEEAKKDSMAIAKNGRLMNWCVGQSQHLRFAKDRQLASREDRLVQSGSAWRRADLRDINAQQRC